MGIGTDDVADTTAELPGVLTLREAAGLLRVSERTVRRWINSGRLGAGRTTAGRGGKLLIARAAIERILRGGE